MRSLACCLFIVIYLQCNLIYQVSAQQCPWTVSGVQYWSNPSTWPNNIVPYSGTVTLPTGSSVVYDITVSGKQFTGITVSNGSKLIFDGTKDVILETNYVNVLKGGSFLIGSVACPYSKKATITLFGPKDTNTSISGMGNKAIINAGNLEFISISPFPTWTRVSQTVNVNSISFLVQDNLVNWKVGESIFIASTDYYQELSEQFTITAINGKNITVDRPIKYMHYGANNEYAEVGYITRNILIQGDISSDLSLYGGHVINYGNSTAKIHGVEFTRMGQKGIIGRYPFHYHVMGEQTGMGHFVNASSFHHTYQRCLTVHGTSGINVNDNVGFNITGHCYFLEEGSETNNNYNHNLAVWINPSATIPTDSRPSGFWITNPNNTFVNNAAVGGSFGFWYSLPLHPLGLTSYQTWVSPRSTTLGKFEGNVAHSAQSNGVHIDDGPQSDGVSEQFSYSPSVTTYSTALFKNTNAYKNRGYGMWMKGNYLIIDNALLQDNGAGINTPGSNNLVQYSTLIAETQNIGTPAFTKYFDDLGRSRPRLWFTNWKIRGWESYDNAGGQFGRGNKFINFTSNNVRDAGALSSLPSGPYNNPPTDILTESTMINSNVFVQNTYGTDSDGPRHVVIHDSDGSITGSYGSYVCANNSILLYANNCTKKPLWNDYYHCQSTEHGYSNIEIKNTNVANTDIKNSSSSFFRATFVPFGQPNIKDNVTGGPTTATTRSFYTTNVISRKGYVLQFPHPTPPQLQVNLRYASTGEWIVLALSYPPTTTFTITRGYSKTALLNVTSLSLLTSTTYFYDSAAQYLYVMYFEDNGKVDNVTGFPMYGYGESYIDITASCGKFCTPTITVQSIPSTFNHGEDSYKAKLSGCGNTSPYEGKAFFYYNSKTKRVNYLIYHNIPRGATAKITTNNANDVNGVFFTLPVAQSPIRGGFPVSWTKHNELWNGNWTITISPLDSSLSISGKLGCVNSCSSPPVISSYDPCTIVNKENVLYNDSINTNIGWADWSWGSNRTFNFSADKLCGNNAIKMGYYPYSSLTLHVGIGNCVPGSCSASWQKPFVNVSTYYYLQFVARSPNGPLINVPLSVRANNHLDVSVGPEKQITFNYVNNLLVENSWTRIRVPLSDLGFKGNELIGSFSIMMNGGSGVTTVLLDEIKLVPFYTDTVNKSPIGVMKAYSESC